MSSSLPVLFVGHGSPLNAIADNRWSRAHAALAGALPRPRAVLCVSAHWFGQGLFVDDSERPATIHDFGGFPRELHEFDYPAPGAPGLAQQVEQLLQPWQPRRRARGLDHGAWAVLCRMFPAADVPVLQVSLDASRDGADHVAMGRALRPLREQGVLILGSGNVVHDLGDAFARAAAGDDEVPDWAHDADAAIAELLRRRDADGLARFWPESPLARRAHPTPDHWLPLLHVAGAARPGDELTFPIEGFDLGSLSMRSVRFG